MMAGSIRKRWKIAETFQVCVSCQIPSACSWLPIFLICRGAYFSSSRICNTPLDVPRAGWAHRHMLQAALSPQCSSWKRKRIDMEMKKGHTTPDVNLLVLRMSSIVGGAHRQQDHILSSCLLHSLSTYLRYNFHHCDFSISHSGVNKSQVAR